MFDDNIILDCVFWGWVLFLWFDVFGSFNIEFSVI